MPKRTLELLAILDAYGFVDEDFRIIHHREGNTIHAHRQYCERVSEFLPGDSTNALVRRRLALIVGALRGGDFSQPAKAGVLTHLASAARSEIPL